MSSINDAFALGSTHVKIFIESLPHCGFAKDELFNWLAHYMNPLPVEMESYLRGYLQRVQEELLREAS
jgi:hypothetical protein